MKKNLTQLLIILTFVLLAMTRLGIEISGVFVDRRLSWIPSFLCYYLVIYLSYRWAVKKELIPPFVAKLTFKPIPTFWVLFWGVVIPGLLPLPVFIESSDKVPNVFFLYITIFALINPWFEEIFWRHTLSHLPLSKWKIILISASFFAFSHYWFWHNWFGSWLITVPTMISTFLMGVFWMRFYLKEKKLIYPIISHMVVDFLNLSVAVFYASDLYLSH